MFIITVFSVIFGIALKVALADYGAVVAFVLWGVAFFFDYVSTILVPHYQKYETNKMFHVLRKHMSDTKSFCIIGAVALAVQVSVYTIFSDLIITYIMTVSCVCTIISNLHARKKLLKYNSSMV